MNVVYMNEGTITYSQTEILQIQSQFYSKLYVSLRLRVQNAVPAQPCVGKY